MTGEDLRLIRVSYSESRAYDHTGLVSSHDMSDGNDALLLRDRAIGEGARRGSRLSGIRMDASMGGSRFVGEHLVQGHFCALGRLLEKCWDRGEGGRGSRGREDAL